jgi:hypothetical protein
MARWVIISWYLVVLPFSSAFLCLLMLDACQDARELIPLSALDHIIEDEDGAVVAALKDHDILVFGFFVVEDLVHAQGHCLTRPHITDFSEPAI